MLGCTGSKREWVVIAVSSKIKGKRKECTSYFVCYLRKSNEGLCFFENQGRKSDGLGLCCFKIRWRRWGFSCVFLRKLKTKKMTTILFFLRNQNQGFRGRMRKNQEKESKKEIRERRNSKKKKSEEEGEHWRENH